MDSVSDLYVFNEIVRAGSFVGAAARLNMTPSGVSKKLSRFENRLKVRLLNRTTRTLALTESGRELHSRGQAILSSIEEAEAQARHVSLAPQGHLRVACSDAFAIQVVLPMLAAFQKNYPDVTVTLLQGDGPLDLIEEQVDLAIRFERPTNASFVAKRLVGDPWIVCASPSYLDQFGLPEQPSDLVVHRCLTIHARGRELDRWVFNRGDAEEEIRISSSFSGIGLVVKAAAMQGLGIARLAAFLVKDDIASGQLVPLFSDYQSAEERAIYAVYPHREFLPLKVRAFIDELNEAVCGSL